MSIPAPDRIWIREDRFGIDLDGAYAAKPEDVDSVEYIRADLAPASPPVESPAPGPGCPYPGRRYLTVGEIVEAGLEESIRAYLEGALPGRMGSIKVMAREIAALAAPLPKEAPVGLDAYALVKSWQVPLWDAINAYMLACGGSDTKGGVKRELAVAKFNRTLESLLDGSRRATQAPASADTQTDNTKNKEDV